jgi:hypothetical protein
MLSAQQISLGPLHRPKNRKRLCELFQCGHVGEFLKKGPEFEKRGTRGRCPQQVSNHRTRSPSLFCKNLSSGCRMALERCIYEALRAISWSGIGRIGCDG